MIVDLDELDRCNEYIRGINAEKLSSIVWVRFGTLIPVTDQQRKEFAVIGLNNANFPCVMEIEKPESTIDTPEDNR